MMSLRYRYFLLGIGWFSGLLSFIFFKLLTRYRPYTEVEQWGTGPLEFVAGIIFGTVIFVYFVFIFRKEPFLIGKGTTWFIGSIIGYYIAVQITLFYLGDYSGFFLGGMVGAFIVGCFLRVTFFRISAPQILLLAFLGGVLGLSWFIFSDDNSFLYEQIMAFSNFLFPGYSNSDDPAFFVLYTIWQAGIACAIGIFLDRKNASQLVKIQGTP